MEFKANIYNWNHMGQKIFELQIPWYSFFFLPILNFDCLQTKTFATILGKIVNYVRPGLGVIKLEYSLRLKIKAQWLAACRHVSASSQSLHFILSLRMNSSLITWRPGLNPKHLIISERFFWKSYLWKLKSLHNLPAWQEFTLILPQFFVLKCCLLFTSAKYIQVHWLDIFM